MSAEKAPNLKIGAVEGVDDLFEVSPAAVRKLQTDEIVIGLCAPAGSPVHKVAEDLRRLFVQRYGYECEVIRLSRLIQEIDGAVQSASRFERIQGLIDKGNGLRRRFGHSVLADLAISRIAKAREKVKIVAGEARYSSRRICYIIDSIKNSDELDILRLVYREMFYFLGVFAPLHVRQKELEAEGMASCARHIIAAGIRDVYYIEPYRKSLATKLHDDAITEDEETRDKVRILPFDGVSPRRYLDLFRIGASHRKANGLAVQADPRQVHPISSGMLESVPALEGLVVQSLVSRKILEG
jgi:hypothetical protein